MRADFWKFSAVSLGLGFAMFGLPHLLFGLLIGAWTDRLDRKRLMIVVDLLSAVPSATPSATWMFRRPWRPPVASS